MKAYMVGKTGDHWFRIAKFCTRNQKRNLQHNKWGGGGNDSFDKKKWPFLLPLYGWNTDDVELSNK